LGVERMLKLPTYATVRIVKLRGDVDHSVITSSFDVPPVPAIGDVGTIVDPTADLKLYLVEKARPDGYTDWLATFAEDELEIVD